MSPCPSIEALGVLAHDWWEVILHEALLAVKHLGSREEAETQKQYRQIQRFIDDGDEAVLW